MTEPRKIVEEMKGEGDLIRDLRTENKNLKRELELATKAKDEEINNLKVKLANETKEKNEEINKRKMAVTKCKQFKNEVNRENKVVTATMVVMDERIIHLEKELKNSQEEVNITRMEQKLKGSQEEAKNINLEEQLKVSQEQLKTCEEESAHYLQSFYRVMRRLVEVDVKLQAQTEEIKKLNEDVEILQKFKQNYKARDINNKWIMEQLDELEHVTTNFSFLRRRTSKRDLIKRLKDLIGLTMKMRYVEEDNADGEELQLR